MTCHHQPFLHFRYELLLKDERKRKRRLGLIKKAHELYLLGEKDVYLVIRHHNRHYMYVSTDQASWPPAPEQIVRTMCGVVPDTQ